MKNTLLSILVLTSIFGAITLNSTTAVSAEAGVDAKPDANRDYLIDKMNRLYLSLAPNDPSRNAIVLRLADLLAERARQNTMLKADGKCQKCVSPEADRAKALQYYSESLAKLSEDKKDKVLVQIGHLNQLLGQEKKALDAYSRLADEGSTPSAKSEAYLSMAEMHFKKSQWQLANANYEKSIEHNKNNSGSKGFALYKQGWSLFNLGKVSEGKNNLLTVLKTPAYMSKSGSGESVTDTAFQEQVAHDYAEIAGRDFKESDLDNILQLSPVTKKLDNLFTVATELERTGKKENAIKAWSFLHQNQPQPEDRALTKAHMATVHLQMGKNAEASQDFNEAFSLISQAKDKKSPALEDARRLLKATIVTWNQAEKKAPSVELLETYKNYLANFGYEKEMNQWAVQTAVDLKKWNEAWQIHSDATAVISQQAQTKPTAENTKLLETHLLQGIELGELAKDPQILRTAQDEYLAKSLSKSKAWEVAYQKAYTGYENATASKANGTKDAAFLADLEKVVMSKQAPTDLRIKSGDLYLDYLAASTESAAATAATAATPATTKTKKNDAEIEAKARQFHAQLSGAKGYNSDWLKIAEKSVLNQVAEQVQLVNNDQAWAVLQKFEPKNAEAKDVVTYYKNKVVLAEKRKDIASAMEATKSLLSLKDLSAEDKSFAQTKMAFYSDLKMDFKTALTMTEQLPQSVISEDKKNLKLALYSDLLGQGTAAYLKKYIPVAKDQEAKLAAISEVIRASKTPDTEIKAYEKDLATKTELLGEMALLSYAKPKDQKEKDKSYAMTLMKKYPALKETAGGLAIYRDQQLSAMNQLVPQIQKMHLDNDATKKTYQKTLVQDMKTRVQSLDKLDVFAADAIKSKDWTLQVVTLGAVARESDRFYNEIMSLPMPEGLTPEEQGEYMRLLGERAAPYKVKSEQVFGKLKDFWSNADGLASVEKRLQGPYQDLAKNEKTAIMSVVTEENKARVVALSEKPTSATVAAGGNPAGTAPQNLEQARSAVKNDPFNVGLVENLKQLEQQRGNLSMVQYLEGRLTDLKSVQDSNVNKGVQ